MQTPSISKTAQVVIGANFGDEGKGLITDFLAAQVGSGGLVVRFNGGAQAGHTVVTPDGRRHVFSHFGCGSFCGLPTFLSRFFVCNPILFLREGQVLQAAGIHPSVGVDPDAPVTTPYDMLINQMAEAARGAARHGSCGVGFGETLERDQYADYRITVADLERQGWLATRLDAIRRHYVPARLAALGLARLSEEQRTLLASDDLLQHFLADAQAFRAAITVADISTLRNADGVIFEGAQGLLLDQQRGCFPHVTRSHTGLRNVLALAREAGIGHLDVHYVSRAYLTRHGAGPMPNEADGLPYPDIVDATNVPNAYQGRLRFGLLDMDLLRRSLGDDLADAQGSGIIVSPALALTCLDQIGEAALRYQWEGVLQASTPEGLLQAAGNNLPVARLLASFGPSRDAIRCG